MDKQKSIDISEPKKTDVFGTDTTTMPDIRHWVNPEFERILLKEALGGLGGPATDYITTQS